MHVTPPLKHVPLIVDLDGTLIHTDMLYESVLEVLRNQPWMLIYVPLWLIHGKAFLKHQLADQTDRSPEYLPYHTALIAWLQEQRDQGKVLILCTASDCTIANAIAKHLGLFDEVIASDGQTNLTGARKAEILQQRFGQSGFDYIGNTNADLPVWEVARVGIVVSASKRLQEKAKQCCPIECTFPPPPVTMDTCLRMLRVHQWIKNLLLFVPILAAHQFADIKTWSNLVLAFLAFSLCASAIYIMNDLFDLKHDRKHVYKRTRPLASGSIPIKIGMFLAPVLLGMSFWLGAYIEKQLFLLMLLYFTITCAYSWGIKRLIIIDCIVLTILFTLRIIGGAIVANHTVSFWLLTFSIFMFLSLAFVKRYTELKAQDYDQDEKIHGRGYYHQDAPFIQAMGVAAGYTAVLVLALYINSTAIVKLYSVPEFIWGVVPITLFWINWIWIQAHRGNMHDDPILFAVRDKVSLISGSIFLLFVGLGTIGWPW